MSRRPRLCAVCNKFYEAHEVVLVGLDGQIYIVCVWCYGVKKGDKK